MWIRWRSKTWLRQQETETLPLALFQGFKASIIMAANFAKFMNL